MADAIVEKIQPCLLDRLTDENPEAHKESRSERIVSMRRYRDGVLRDLAWLLNAKAHTTAEGLNQFPRGRPLGLEFRHTGSLRLDIDTHGFG